MAGRYLNLLLLLLAVAFSAHAEESLADKNIRIVYVEHNLKTDKTALTKDLDEFREDAYYGGLAIYLSAVNESVLLEYNLGGENPSDEQFASLIGSINNSLYHNVDASTDVDNLNKLFDDVDLIDADGKLKCASLEILFYVTGRFFELGFHKSIIEPIFSILDIPQLDKKGRVSFEVLYPASDPDQGFINKNAPFGPENLDGINDYFKENQAIIPYK